MKPDAPESDLRYYLDPFGCVKNQVDAENMMAYLDHAGWAAAQDAANADLIIINSCGFIESAKRESINAVLNWRKLYPDKKILLAGCLAQRYAKELSESLPEADGFFGVNNISSIVETVRDLGIREEEGTRDWGLGIREEEDGTGDQGLGIREEGEGTRDWGLGIRERSSKHSGASGQYSGNPNSNPRSLIPDPRSPSSRPLLSLPGSAYVKISEGCNNRCSFCAIPLIRGALRCRTVPDIVEECRGLLCRGIKELCIIGQDIGSYCSGTARLPELLNGIAGIAGNFWVRLLYIHPDHFPLPILDIMEGDPRFLPYFDLPFQHAAPGILSAMNRHGTAEDYIALAETISSRLPAAVIRTTFLTGFPGETDADFASLLQFQKKLRPHWLGCFTYSREDGTPAFTMKKQVPKKIAAQRRKEIEEQQVQITTENMDRFTGQKLHVLLEEQFRNYMEDDEEGFAVRFLGRLYCHAPEVDGSAVVVDTGTEAQAGDLLPCKVIARRGFDLEVRLFSA